MGITGQDMVKETRAEVDTQMNLGFGKCKLCLLGPEKKIEKLKGSSMAGMRVVTSFPNIAADFFKDLVPKPKIQYVSGSVEVACALGLADAVVDLVETGTTMRAAGLDIIEKIMDTQCVLISNTKTKHKAMIKTLRGRLDGYITAQKYILMVYNMPKDRLKDAIAITPGKRSPSLMSLEDSNWVAVSVLVLKSQASNIMDKLESVGARDILCTSLVNCRV
jgi:ATP phosphoribosyltransferase